MSEYVVKAHSNKFGVFRHGMFIPPLLATEHQAIELLNTLQRESKALREAQKQIANLQAENETYKQIQNTLIRYLAVSETE